MEESCYRKSVGGRRYVALNRTQIDIIFCIALCNNVCMSINRKQGTFYLLLIAGVAKTLIKVTNHPRNRLMEAATLNSSRTGRQAMSHGQPLLLAWECAHYRVLGRLFELKSFQNAKPAESTEMLPLWIYLYVHLSLQSVIRYVQEVKDNWTWLVLSPHLKGCLFILDTSDDPSELERFKERFKVGDPFQCHIRSVNHERKQVDLSLQKQTYCARQMGKYQKSSCNDTWIDDPAILFTEGQFVRCRVLDLKRPGRGKMGLELSGFVKNVMEKGFFVVLSPSLEARIQLKNLSNSFVQNPAEMFPPGKVISGRILSIEPLSGHIEMSLVDAETKRISLGMKAVFLTPEDGIEPMEEEAINEEPSNTNVLMDNDEREEEDYLDLASKRFPQLCMEAAAKEKLLQKDQPPETKDDFERLVAASPNSSSM
ncbi:hypothetical protein SELMODRAFT_412232 [Selaginella moellendorffii]|uniref:S1 motif domain-containing protein n=1 Tax=Selaginella moellendorffii TaxID=88036 RepID=D8RKI0_SELML|nr:hypothetical protein SELMODRAFT_412232 [Selaginella moellendorffii]